MTWTILQADARHIPLADKSVQCVVTSPPYWGLRDYGTATWVGGETGVDWNYYHPADRPNEWIEPDANHPESWVREGCDHKPPASRKGDYPDSDRKQQTNSGSFGYREWQDCGKCGATRIDSQIGLEPTPEEYVAKIVAVFAEVWRVLRDDGTCWVNLGDSYHNVRVSTTGQSVHDGEMRDKINGGNRHKQSGLKPKDLVGIPWRVAFALQAAGWTLRSEIIWSKPNPMPESVSDRPTKAHEQIFMFSKAKWTGPEPRRFAHISDADAKWLALFLDTEGNICDKRARASSGTDHFGTQISFGSTSRELITEAHRIIRSGAILERPGKNAPMFYYQFSNNQAADLLYRLYPFLIVKQRQAALGIYLQSVIAKSNHERRTKEGRLRGRLRDDDYTEELIKIWATMKALNHFQNPDLSWVPTPKYGRWDSQPYYFDQDAVREAVSGGTHGGAWNEGGWKQAALGQQKGGRLGNEPENGCRNIRTVWEIATQPFPSAHFATFPEEIAIRCIKAGTSEKGACRECGAPWERVTEREAILHRPNSDSIRGSSPSSHRALGGPQQGARSVNSTTLGWQSTCKHDAPTVPCIVLDPFSGAGTVPLVADKLNRRGIGLELKWDYVRMAHDRCYDDAPLLLMEEIT